MVRPGSSIQARQTGKARLSGRGVKYISEIENTNRRASRLLVFYLNAFQIN